MNNDITENINNYDNLTIEQKNTEIMKEIKNRLDITINKKCNDYLNILQNEDLFNLKSAYIQDDLAQKYQYYYDFIILTEKRFESFIKNLNINKNNFNKYYCFLGDNRIFLTINNNNQYIIELGYITNKINFINELFLVFDSQNIYEKNKYSLFDKGYSNYSKSSLMLRDNDYACHIFDDNGTIVGKAFKYINICNILTEYDGHFINKYLIIEVKLYLHNEQLKNILLDSKSLDFKQYYLLSEDWLNTFKNYYYYNNVENILKYNSLLNTIRKLLIIQ
jgi:hypothetical protein